MARHKTCPDCAEEVKAAAKVCRYCSHQFDVASEKASVKQERKDMMTGSLIILVILGAVVLYFNPGDTSSQSETVAVAAAEAETQIAQDTSDPQASDPVDAGDDVISAGTQNCRDALEDAVDAGFITPDAIDHNGVRMIVDIGFWRGSGLSARRGMVNAIECAIAGEGQGLTSLVLLSSATGQVVARKQGGGAVEILE